MIYAVEMRENRNACFILHPLDQRLAAARNDDIDQPVGLQHRADCRPVCSLDKLDGMFGQTGFDHACRHGVKNRPVAFDRLRSTAQDNSIAGSQSQGRCIGGNIGPAFVNDADYTERNPDALHYKAIGLLAAVDDLSDWVGKIGDLLYRISNRCEPTFVDHQPVQHGVTQPARAGIFHIALIGGQYGGLAGAQMSRSGSQGIGFLGIAHAGQHRECSPRLVSHFGDQFYSFCHKWLLAWRREQFNPQSLPSGQMKIYLLVNSRFARIPPN